MGTTANYSWPYPESSDFVADGATAIENLADAVDTTVGGFGTWTSYTPGFLNLTLGNGTLSAAYCRTNDFVTVRVTLLFGSTTSVSGQIKLSLPTGSNSALQNHPIGSLRMLDAGTANYMGHIEIDSSTYAALFEHAVVNAPLVGRYLVNATQPMTWTTNDIFWAYFTYEAA